MKNSTISISHVVSLRKSSAETSTATSTPCRTIFYGPSVMARSTTSPRRLLTARKCQVFAIAMLLLKPNLSVSHKVTSGRVSLSVRHPSPKGSDSLALGIAQGKLMGTGPHAL